jgi:hypothetical protein
MGPSLEEPGVFCPKQIYYRLVRPQLENVSAKPFYAIVHSFSVPYTHMYDASQCSFAVLVPIPVAFLCCQSQGIFGV